MISDIVSIESRLDAIEQKLQDMVDDAADDRELRSMGHYLVIDDNGRCNVPGMMFTEAGISEIRRRMKRREERIRR